MIVSSLPVRIDPSDWLDEELPILGRFQPDTVPGRPDPDVLALSYSPVAELDEVDVVERASAIAPLAVDDTVGAEISAGTGNFD
jgi:hypothetical protein